MTAEGEESHDYEIITQWYDPSELTMNNLGLSVKCRCKNCGRIVALSPKDFIQLAHKYRNASSSHANEFHYEELINDYKFYELPLNCGPFDIRYIYDDGRMKIVPIDKSGDTHTHRSKAAIESGEDIHMVKVEEL